MLDDQQVFQINRISSALVMGAGHGIGLALVEELLGKDSIEKVYCSYRDSAKAGNLVDLSKKYQSRLCITQVDPCKESEVETWVETIKASCENLDLFINCVGFLDSGEIQPEKRLADIDPAQLQKYFEVNTVPSVVLAKHIFPLISRQSISSFVGISAKVGSITDNQLGGWYGYRSSKAALNMLLKGMALEMKMRKRNCVVLSIHPGTTKTELTKGYVEKTNLKVHTASQTASNILSVVNGKTINETGRFYSWDNTELAW